MSKKIIGISSCLLGNQVRYDGGHKQDHWITETLGQYVDFYPVCPEFECGLTIPRESMNLEGPAENPRLITTESRQDLTEQMISWMSQKWKDLEEANLVAFILKSKSPSCGGHSLKVYNFLGKVISENGQGLFARELIPRFPHMIVVDEAQLQDADFRDAFFKKISHNH